MIKLLNFIITKIEKNTKDTEKRNLYRDILNLIDKYNFNVYHFVTIRYYRYFTFDVDDIDIRR